jgi:hypothetical protein
MQKLYIKNTLVVDQHIKLDFHTASTLRQLLAGGHVAPLWHIIHIPSFPVLLWRLNIACLVLKQKISNLSI